MTQTPKRKLIVEVIPGPRAAAPGDALAHATSVLTAATHIRQVDADRRVKEAQRALAPVVEDAKKILGDVDELYKKHGDQLHKLSAINWPALQARGISPDHTNRVNRLVSELLNTFGGVRATLGDIARRVDGIVAESRFGGESLEPRAYGPFSWQPAGVYPMGPTRIRLDVEMNRNVCDGLRAKLSELEHALSQVEDRLQTSPTANVTFVKIERPEDRAQPLQSRMQSDFDPLSYGR